MGVAAGRSEVGSIFGGFPRARQPGELARRRFRCVFPVSTLAPLSCGSRRIIQVDAAHWWWLRRDHSYDCKALRVYSNTQ